MADDRADQTQRPSVKKGIDSNEQRRRKQDTTLSIRKTKRLESQQKRRQAAQQPAAEQRDAQFFSPEPTLQPTRHFDPETAFVTRVEENYVVYDKKQEVVFDANELPKLLRAIMSSDRRLVITATAHFRKLLSIESHPPISQIIRCPRLIERLVSFLRADEDPALQFEAAWALTNVASGTPEQTRVVIEHEAVPLFVALLSSPNDDVREQSVWALGNIAGDSPRCRDLVLDAGARDPLIKCIYSAKRITMLRNATWAISNLSRGKPPPPFAKVKPFLSVLSRLIFSIDDEVVTDACWALSYLSEGANERVQALIESGVCRRLVELIMHPHPGVVTPALRTIGNVVTGDDLQTQVVVDAFAVPALVEALHSKKKGIKKEACWTLSNITAGDRSQIEAVIKADAVKPLVHLLKTAEFDIRKEAAWALSNACSGGSERQIHEVVKHGFIGPLVELLSINDVRMTLVGLDALEHILEAGRLLQHRNQIPKNPYVIALERVEGIKKLDSLLASDNEELYKKATAIINRYCSAAPKEDTYVAPRRGADSFQVNTSHLEDLDDLGGLSDEPGDDD